MLPEFTDQSWNKGLSHLASALVRMGTSKHRALLITGLEDSLTLKHDGFGDVEWAEWDDLPDELRSWLRAQDGLKVDRHPIDSTDSLITTHRLLCQGNKPTRKCIQTCGALGIALDIAARYFLHIERVRFQESAIDDLIVYGEPPRNIVSRCCGICDQQILDDAFARYKKADPQRYVLRFMRGGADFPDVLDQLTSGVFHLIQA